MRKHSCQVHNVARRFGNPLRQDPTRTVMVRKAYISEVNRRFRRLRMDVWDFMVTKDALALKDRKSFFTANVQPREFEFRSSADKVKTFNDWFKQQMDAQILSPSPGTPIDKPWTAKYTESAYRRGLTNAYLASKQPALDEAAGVGEMSQEAFLKSSFGAPEATSKIKLLATRAFEDLKGVTSAMGSKMNGILAQGIADGKGAEAIAREMTKSVAKLTKTRALVIARTEVIRAHAEGQLDAFKKLNVKKLGLKAEWSTAGDDRVCPQCAPLEGKVYTLKQAAGLIPAHPQCRCSWLPHV